MVAIVLMYTYETYFCKNVIVLFVSVSLNLGNLDEDLNFSVDGIFSTEKSLEILLNNLLRKELTICYNIFSTYRYY